MRWKLLVITSIVSSLLSTGSVIFFGLQTILNRRVTTGLSAGLTIALPLIFTAAASFFVYRHTSRRRKLQAALTVLFAAVLTLTAITTIVLLSAHKRQTENITASARS